jgi:hypothetical protein
MSPTRYWQQQVEYGRVDVEMLGSDDEHLLETEGQGGTGMAAGMEDKEEEEEEEECPWGPLNHTRRRMTGVRWC